MPEFYYRPYGMEFLEYLRKQMGRRYFATLEHQYKDDVDVFLY